MSRLASLMNRYRAWIDGGSGWRVFLASWALSSLTMFILVGLTHAALFGWRWLAIATVAAVPIYTFLAVAQMTMWRWRNGESQDAGGTA